jgi:GT2 family glycosyltransferase
MQTEHALIARSQEGHSRQGAPAARIALIVLGDPGSRGSAVTRALAQRGAREALELEDLGDELAEAVGSSWDDTLALPRESLRTPRVAQLRDRVRRALAGDRLPGGDVLLLDDPRMCRFVPFWVDALNASGVEARFVLAFRDPLESASALHARHGLPEDLAKLLWLRYLIDAERDTREHRRSFITGGDLAAHATAIDRLCEALELPVAPKAEPADRSFDGHASPAATEVADGPDGGEVEAWTRSAYRSFVSAARGEPATRLSSTLTPIEGDLDARLRVVAPAVEAQRERASELNEDLRRTRKELRSARVQRAEREHAIVAIEMQFAELIGSTSWRLTAPLRRVTRALERVRGRSRSWPRLGGGRGSGDFPASDAARYQAWAARYDKLDDESRAELHSRLAQLSHAPVISVLMATYEPDEEHLREAISSVRNQVYTHWELCIADDASTSSHVRRVLDEAARDGRIKVTYRERNGHISAAYNSALGLATGDFVSFLDHDDLLPEHALAEVALELNRHPDADFVYSDEDRLDVRGGRCEPYFKPDWNPELLLCNNYLCHLSVVRRELVERVGAFREGFEGSQDYDLFLRATAEIDDASRIRHVPRVLYHWRKHAGSTAEELGAKPYAPIAGRRALADRLAGEDVSVEHGPVTTFYRVRYPVPDPPPLVSLIIPTRDGRELLTDCVESILGTTDYRAFELIVVDNGSRDRATRSYLAELPERPQCRVIQYDGPFNFAAINNFAAREAAGEVLGFVNDDIEVQNADWLEEMVSHAMRPEVGAVGAKLLYPDGRVQHGGIALGIGGVAGHMHKDWPARDPGYFGRLISVQAVSAVTGACMLVSRSKFEEVGGLNEKDLAIAFNDVDLCLRLREAGYRNVWNPYAVLWHAESASRGYEDTDEKRERFDTETAYMKRRWGPQLLADPYYNPNLTLRSEGFEVAETPRNASAVATAARG